MIGTTVYLDGLSSLERNSSRDGVYNLPSVVQLPLQLMLSDVLVLREAKKISSSPSQLSRFRSLLCVGAPFSRKLARSRGTTPLDECRPHLASVRVLESDVLSIGVALCDSHVSLGRTLEGRLRGDLQ